jgi:hypothetical protein
MPVIESFFSDTISQHNNPVILLATQHIDILSGQLNSTLSTPFCLGDVTAERFVCPMPIARFA